MDFFPPIYHYLRSPRLYIHEFEKYLQSLSV
jgi:hypothetical protein